MHLKRDRKLLYGIGIEVRIAYRIVYPLAMNLNDERKGEKSAIVGTSRSKVDFWIWNEDYRRNSDKFPYVMLRGDMKETDWNMWRVS